ncbi:MAG: oligosaccharide flippase family protein, partial [Candidatus Omnitrophota bacterium]
MKDLRLTFKFLKCKLNTMKGKIFTARERKVVLENFTSLSTLQGLSYLLPLVILPYLIRTIGPEKFGLISFAQALIQYFMIFT